MDNGDYDIALELNKDIYEISRKNLGKDDTDTINAMRTLASNYSMLFEHEKALELKEALLSTDSPFTPETSEESSEEE